MTPTAKSPAPKLMTAADRASLREAQREWSSPTLLSLFEEWDLKDAVLKAYKRLRKFGQDPESALFFALDDCDLFPKPAAKRPRRRAIEMRAQSQGDDSLAGRAR